jgi:hypothetical protein
MANVHLLPPCFYASPRHGTDHILRVCFHEAASRYLFCGMYAQCRHQEVMVTICFLLIHACVLDVVAVLPSYGDHATCYYPKLVVLPPCCGGASSDAPPNFDHTFLIIVLHSDGGRPSYIWWSCFVPQQSSGRRKAAT